MERKPLIEAVKRRININTAIMNPPIDCLSKYDALSPQIKRFLDYEKIANSLDEQETQTLLRYYGEQVGRLEDLDLFSFGK